MNSNMFIPSKLKIGFCERSDTFTKKLAYVIYYDEKGKLRSKALGSLGEIRISRQLKLTIFQRQDMY